MTDLKEMRAELEAEARALLPQLEANPEDKLCQALAYLVRMELRRK